MSSLPRVLFLSNEAPHTAAAGAIFFHRLLAEYPTDRLLVVTSHLPPAHATRLDCRYVHLPLKADRLNRTRFWPWRAILRVCGGSSFLNLKRIDEALGDFQPDVVVTLMQDSWFYDFAAHYARRRKLPLVVFVHDLPAGFEPVPAWLRARQQERDASVYRQAIRRVCISHPMTEHLASSFGATGEFLLPPRADVPPRQAPENCRQLKQPGQLTLGYAGGLHYGYGEQLLAMLPMLRATGTKLELFGPPPSGKVAALADATDVVRLHGYTATPEAAWQSLLTRCDVILQPYLDPAGEHALQYRTHFPSKLGDALSLGLPLLITGPEYAAGVAWCQQHPGSACWTGNPTDEALRQALHRLLTDSDLRVSLATQAQATAEEFAAPRLRRQFHEILCQSVGRPSIVPS